MVERASLYQVSGLPDAFSVVILVFLFILLLSPYFSGADFGIFKVPKFTRSAKKWLKTLGPVMFLICVGAFLPILPFTGVVEITDIIVKPDIVYNFDTAGSDDILKNLPVPVSRVDFRVTNKSKAPASISRVRFKVVALSVECVYSYVPPSATYGLDITELSGEGQEAEVAVSQRVGAGEDDRFVITLSVKRDACHRKWTLEPTLVTSGGEVKGKNIQVGL